MKLTIIKVLRNTFLDKNGNEVKYCKFTCLVPSTKTEDSTGYDIIEYTTKYENYDLIAKIVESNKTIFLQCEYKKLSSGLFKAVPIKIDETMLN